VTSVPVLLKVLSAKGNPHHGGHGSWPLPKNGKPGKWLKVEGELVPCQNGLHLCTPEQLLSWLGPTLWIAEAGKEREVQTDKIVVRRARLLRQVTTWDEKSARLFAADCAEWALKQERKAGREPDKRSWNCVRIVRDYARGKAGEEERSAAGSAARSAAESAARSAARSAAWSAAWSAARSAWSAADSAAWSTAQDWQTKRLLRYLKLEQFA
jgi:hypothetical protein